MSVVVTSVIILFALIFLGFFLGKGHVIQHESIPDLSNLIIKVTMPVTVFLSIVEQQGERNFSAIWQMLLASAVLYAISFLITLLTVRLLRVPEQERGAWLFSGMISNCGFMGLPLSLAIFGSQGMFYMAIGNIIGNMLIFSVGTIFLTRHYSVTGKIGLRDMLFNNINIAVVVGLIFWLANIPLPAFASQLLNYLGNITSGLAMLVVGLSLSRLAFKDVFADRKMYFLPVLRLLIVPLVVVLIFRLIPFEINPVVEGAIMLTASLPAASAQSMITEQYHTNTAAASRAVFITTLFSVVTVPLMMMLII